MEAALAFVTGMPHRAPAIRHMLQAFVKSLKIMRRPHPLCFDVVHYAGTPPVGVARSYLYPCSFHTEGGQVVRCACRLQQH